MTVSDLLKTENAALVTEAALTSPVDVLQGVTAEARAALEAVDIRTVFDLAVSHLFATAAALTAAETDATTLESRLNGAAADAVDPPPGLAVGEWARQGLSILASLEPAKATALETALAIQTVRDFALWPPFRSAKAILADALGGAASVDEDASTPADLLPKSGVYPTERVFYSRLLIDLAPQAAQGTTPIEQAGAIDLGASLSAPTAFQRLAVGALATFSQSWYSEGVTLGQMLHSLTLAPGESTRIALLDWSRRVGASLTEQIDEREQLASTQTHNRALTEVTDSTASEFQSGHSTTHVESQSGQSGGAFGLEIGPLALGGSSGGGSSTTTATSTASSFGARDLAASLAQNINDRTQQNASSARSRRASVVSEVSQAEHESITTRIVTNYNHMHALNVQYFELVQAYRVTTELDRVERCLFVPLQLLDFHNDALVARLRTTLARAALTGAAFRQLTSEYGAVEIIPRTPRVFPGNIGVHDRGRASVLARTIPTASAGGTGDSTAAVVETALPLNQRVADGPAAAPITLAAAKGWDLDQVIHLGSVMSGVPLRSGSDSVFVPDDAQLLSVALRDGQAARFQVRKRDNTEVALNAITPTSFVLSAPTRFADLQTVAVQSSVDRDVTTTLALNLNANNAVVTLDVPVRFRSSTSVPGLQDVISFGAVEPSPDLIAHLEANRLHYSRAAYANLDAATIAGILAKFTYRGVALTRVVDPQPVAMTANFLVFRMNVPREGDPDDPRFAEEQQEFRAFLTSRGLDTAVAKSEIVPLPTGGVFAEAVLGRFNAAEKIDLERFWNWQDSPIPIAAPEIAPVEAASRAEVDTTTPGQFGAPVLKQQAPTALPAAAGVAPILAAIQQANMFRDMSGLAQTAALAQAAVTTTGAGATAAGEQAAKNLFTVMDQNTQRMRIAADLIGSMYGGKGDADKAKGGKSVSERGGQLNAAESMGKQAGGGAAGQAAGGDASGAQAPATLEGQTLAQQSGSGAAATADKIVDAATRPDTGTTTSAPKPKPKPKPTTPTTPAAPATPPAIGGAIDLSKLFPASRHVRLTAYFQNSGGAKIRGNQLIQLRQVAFMTSTMVLELHGVGESALYGGFDLVPSMAALSLEVAAEASTQGGILKGFKPIVLPTNASDDATYLRVSIKPVVNKKTFTVPTSGIFAPDLDDLEQQLTAAGISKEMRTGDLDLTPVGLGGGVFATVPTEFKATVTYFSPELIIKQVL